MIRHLEARARRAGARSLFGDVLRTNTAMKGLARKSGYSIRSPFTDARLVEVVKELSPPSARPCAKRVTMTATPSDNPYTEGRRRFV